MISDKNNTLYIVTGAAGFLGNNVVRALVREGKRVRAVCMPGENTLACEGADELRFADVCDRRAVAEALASDAANTFVIHTAGVVSITGADKALMERVNVGGTKNVVAACSGRPGVRLCYISSVHAIPQGGESAVSTEARTFSPAAVKGAYAKTKAEATAAVLAAVSSGALDAVIVHPSGIIGPYDYGTSHMTGMFLTYLDGKLPVKITGGYDFVDVRDVADGAIAAVERGRKGECYILSGRYVCLPELFSQMAGACGRRLPKIPVPITLVRTVAPFLELHFMRLKRKPLFTSYALSTLCEDRLFSHKKAAEELGYTARPLEDTVADTLEWLAPRAKKPRKPSGSALRARAGGRA